MIPGVVSGALLSWISIINELSASVILYSTKTRTMAIAIYTEVLRGNYGTAAALATILTLTTLIAMLLFFRITRDKDITW
jgi:iron(III) transport system permease protein